MNLDDVRHWVRENGIDPTYISIGKHVSAETLCIVQDEEGWEVYFAQRGWKDGPLYRRFDTEDAACKYFIFLAGKCFSVHLDSHSKS
jgi:hypothetical protein